MNAVLLFRSHVLSCPYEIVAREICQSHNLSRRFTMSASSSLGVPRRFAALAAQAKTRESSGGMQKLRGVIFDMDGTLCEPQNYMFTEMRSVLGITKSEDILDYIYSLPESEQEAANEKIRNIERKAMALQAPQPGLLTLMSYLESKGIKKGICTRNFDTPVAHLLEKFLSGKEFAPIVTREFRPPKPHPAGILHITKSWGLEDGGESVIMVGDSIDDMTAGYSAGAATVLLVNEVNAHLANHEHTDLCIRRLDELVDILENGFRGQITRGDKSSDLKGRAERTLAQDRAEEPKK